MVKQDLSPKRRIYAGLFMVTLATLLLEIALTRIFSVTMWYHFSFMVISVAMFGMSTGAVLVYLLPNFFNQEGVHRHLALSALFLAVSIVLSLLTQLPLVTVFSPTVSGVYSVILRYVVTAIPFVFSGICVCLVMTRFTRHVGGLYAADLAGAATGCVALVFVMKIIDGPTTVMLAGLFAGLGSVFFGAGIVRRRTRTVTVIICVALGLLVAGNSVLARRQRTLLPLLLVKGHLEDRPLYERWNSFSRICVRGDQARLKIPFGWGLSRTYPLDRGVRELRLLIDAAAGTPLTAFDGNPAQLEHLKYDVVNAAYWIRPGGKTLVVGAGGARDVLSALAFGQKAVVAVEINEDIIETVNGRFGDFTGHLDKNPRVTFVNDEARSFAARQTEQFEIIQISLADTWAATAAGAFVLTENSLYTVEAWRIFLERLTPNGILSVSRWYFLEKPGEVYRLTALASASLRGIGISNPRDHVIIIRNRYRGRSAVSDGIGTILVSKAPFSDRDLVALETLCTRMQFEKVLTPRFALDRRFENLASGSNAGTISEELGLNVAAPTDDSPFFFNMLRLKDIFKPRLWRQGIMSMNLKAVFVLGILTVIVVVLTVLCLIVPLLSRMSRGTLKGSSRLLLFFACIGLGFMFVEISQMQRLIVFLGHPTYGLSVVLFALLLSAGAGSLSTKAITQLRAGRWRLLVLLSMLIVFGVLTPHVVWLFRGCVTPLRIMIAIGILLPLGFFMGMAFPMGMKLASVRSSALTPWLLAVNGATSVCASVVAVAVALAFGISSAFWIGFVCYCLAFLVYLREVRLTVAGKNVS